MPAELEKNTLANGIISNLLGTRFPVGNESGTMYIADNIVQEEMRMANGARSGSIVRGFAPSSVFWLLVGLVLGLWLAGEMVYPALAEADSAGTPPKPVNRGRILMGYTAGGGANG
jgi:hypothetical protein